MEIINYSGTKISAINTTFSFTHGTFSLNEFLKNLCTRLSDLSFKEALRSVTGSLRFSAKSLNFQAKTIKEGLSKSLPAVLLATTAILSPVLAVKYTAWRESNYCSIKFQNTSEKELGFLDTAMSSFALNNSAYFDREGNVLLLSNAEDTPLLQESSAENAAASANAASANAASANAASANAASANATSAATYFKQKVSFKSHTVQSGETVSSVCQKFGLKNISTLIAVNKISNVRSLRSGQKLIIPSMDGLNHSVQAGETIEGLSAKYGVSVEDLLDVNDLSSSLLQKGQELFIPGAKMDSTSLRRAMGELFVYPINAAWRLTSRFGYRPDPFTGIKQRHTGIDMACPTGTPIKAAKSGTVSFTGYSNVYGKYVIVTHIDGYQTLYGHMSVITSKKGQSVNQGSQLGLVGSTGYSTGPHLHFSVYKNGKLIDPLSVLK